MKWNEYNQHKLDKLFHVQDLSYSDIAKEMGVSVEVIKAQVRKQGLSRRKVHPWTTREKNKLLILVKRRYRWQLISDIMDRSLDSIHSQFSRMVRLQNKKASSHMTRG